MVKTTVYLPDDLKRRIRDTASLEGCSEAQVIRTALQVYTAPRIEQPLRLPLFTSDQPDLAERVDEHLAGFGER
jgi:hypothetical protein